VTPKDTAEVLALYRRVAREPGGIARLEDEVSEAYVRKFLASTVADGVGLVATEGSGAIVAEIHAYKPGPYCFSHVLSELTVVVDPAEQGERIGKSIFTAFLQVVSEAHPEVSRVELIARQSNQRAIQMYKSLGFRAEGKLVGRIKNVDGSLESDIPMAWFRV